MTREEIEADLVTFIELREGSRFWDDARRWVPFYDKQVNRLQDELARLDGPAPGFVRARTYARVDGAGRYIIWEEDHTGVMAKDEWPRWIAAHPRIEVFVDLPLPRVVEIEGKVEK